MNKKKIIIIILVILILFGIYTLYNTFAVSTIASNNESNVYNITIGEGTTITVPKGSSKTIYFHLKNTNNGSVKYALGYNTTANIEVKVYEDSKDKVSDIIGYTENKYIKLYLNNPTNNSNTVTITSVLGYENGGDLIVPNGITLIEEVYTFKVTATITLTKLGLSVDTTHTPDFTTVSGNNGVKLNEDGDELATGLGDGTNGIYEAEDDLGTSYYFRGDVDNNYVYFAKNWWRIVRINGDGTIRMIYTDDPNNSSSNQYIGNSKYNSSSNDNAYMGYMYGTADSSIYDETHVNMNNSTIKEVIDLWYKNNLSSYSSYIADAIYCNDREVVTGTFGMAGTFNGDGTRINHTAYVSLKRNYIDHIPTLKCTNNNDRFTKSSSLGNGALTYSIGLITTDEVIMSGGNTPDVTTRTFIANDSYYLYPKNGNYYYWTMTPEAYFNKDNDTTGGNAFVNIVDYPGEILDSSVDYDYNAVRPVISLKSNAITGGDGTVSNPFYVNEKPTI